MPTSLLKRRKSAASISSATRSTSFSFSLTTAPPAPLTADAASLHRFHSASFSDVLALDRIDSGSGAAFSSFFSSAGLLRAVFCTLGVSTDLRRCSTDVTDGEGDPVVVAAAAAAALADLLALTGVFSPELDRGKVAGFMTS